MTLEKYKACLILASFGDTFGFRNGHWEFNLGKKNTSIRHDYIIYFCSLLGMGGINNINVKN